MAKSPDIVTVPTESAAVPVLETAKVCGADDSPTTTLPKSLAAGETEMFGSETAVDTVTVLSPGPSASA